MRARLCCLPVFDFTFGVKSFQGRRVFDAIQFLNGLSLLDGIEREDNDDLRHEYRVVIANVHLEFTKNSFNWVKVLEKKFWICHIRRNRRWYQSDEMKKKEIDVFFIQSDFALYPKIYIHSVNYTVVQRFFEWIKIIPVFFSCIIQFELIFLCLRLSLSFVFSSEQEMYGIEFIESGRPTLD